MNGTIYSAEGHSKTGSNPHHQDRTAEKARFGLLKAMKKRGEKHQRCEVQTKERGNASGVDMKCFFESLKRSHAGKRRRIREGTQVTGLGL